MHTRHMRYISSLKCLHHGNSSIVMEIRDEKKKEKKSFTRQADESSSYVINVEEMKTDKIKTQNTLEKCDRYQLKK